MATLIVRNLTKTYGYRHALRDVSFDLTAGEVVAVVGANGAGKTTLLRVLAGLVRPTGGSVRLESHEGAVPRQLIGYVAHDTMLYGDLSAEANLRFYARLYDIADGERRALALLERVGLAERRRERVRGYSHGMRRRLAVARALLHAPRLLLLDEPTAGLDAEATALLEALIAEQAAAGCAVLMATHDHDRALGTVCRVLGLARGRLAMDAPAGEVTAGRWTREDEWCAVTHTSQAAGMVEVYLTQADLCRPLGIIGHVNDHYPIHER